MFSQTAVSSHGTKRRTGTKVTAWRIFFADHFSFRRGVTFSNLYRLIMNKWVAPVTVTGFCGVTENLSDRTNREVGDRMPQNDILIERAQAGDRDALNELVSVYWHSVYRFVCYKTGCPEDAQELTQEAFFRAFRSLPGFRRTDASFKTYLSHIALNLVRDFWRKKGRSPVVVDIADYQKCGGENDQPDVQALNLERREGIARVLQELPTDQRQTVELRILAGLPIRETAAAMGKSEAAVKMLQQRALKSLRWMLVDRGVVDSGTDWR